MSAATGSDGAAPDGDPGLAGVVPFRFACHRCGHCCSGGAGQVWLEEQELPALAARLGMEPEAFARRHVRRVADPAGGAPRLSLVEEGGRCSLLRGANHCAAYEDRPRHCREFPYWPAVLADEAAFERARAVCPGIAVEVPEELRREAFRRLRELYAEVDALVARSGAACELSGRCCRFEEAGHELYATALEADLAAALHPAAPAPEAPGRCPYHERGRCTAREGRPLGCRTYFCDPRTTDELAEAHEAFLGRVRALERDLGYPAGYGRFPDLLAARGVGRPGADGREDAAPRRVEAPVAPSPAVVRPPGDAAPRGDAEPGPGGPRAR